MGIYDIAMLVVLGGAIVFGYWKGLAWQIASVTALVVSYIVAVNFRDQVAQFIQTEPPWNRIGAMLALFLGTSLVIWTIYASVARSLKKNELKGFDRQAGAVLGAVKGALLCMVVTMFSVSFLGENAHNAIDNSTFGPYVEKGIWQVSALVPEELARFVDPHIASYKEAVGHGEPEVDPNGLLDQTIGSVYQIGQKLNQGPGQLPQGNQGENQQQGYLGKWLSPNSSAGENANQQAGQANSGLGSFFGTRSPNTSSSNRGQANPNQGTGGYQGGFLPQYQPGKSSTDWSNISISEASKQMLENARQHGVNLSVEAANEAARRMLESGQQR